MATRHARGVVAALVVLAALTVASSAQVIRPGFQDLIPREVRPEAVKVFFAVAPSGASTDSVTTRAGVYDYTFPIAGARFLKLLIYMPGYQMVTAEFKDAQLDTSTPYTPPLVTLPAVRLDGRLVNSSGRPLRDYGLYLGYHFMESVGYFCGNYCSENRRTDSVCVTRRDAHGRRRRVLVYGPEHARGSVLSKIRTGWRG